MERNTLPVTTARRRAFERDVYDQARALRFSSARAREQVLLVRRRCGQWQTDDDDDADSAWEGEVDVAHRSNSTLMNIVDAPFEALMKINRVAMEIQRSSGAGQRENIIASVEDCPSEVLEAAPAGLNSVQMENVEAENEKAKEIPPSPEQEPKVRLKAKRQMKGKEKRKKASSDTKDSSGSSTLERSKKAPISHGNDRNDGFLGPRSEDEGHRNHLRAKEADKGAAFRMGRTQDQSKEAARRIAEIDEHIRGLRDLTNAKQAESLENGQNKGIGRLMQAETRQKQRDKEDLQSVAQARDGKGQNRKHRMKGLRSNTDEKAEKGLRRAPSTFEKSFHQPMMQSA